MDKRDQARQAKQARREQLEAVVWRAPATGEDPHYMVTWNLPTFLITRARLETLIEQANLFGLETPPIREITAIQRALADLAGRGLVRQVYGDAEEIAWGVLSIVEGDKESKEATLRQGHTVSYLKRPEHGQPSVIYASDETRELVEPMVRQYHESYTSQDVVERVLNPILEKLDAIPFRERGGVYLIPAGATETVMKLRDLARLLSVETGLECHVSTLAMVNTEMAREDIRYHGNQGLIMDMRVMQTRLRDMLRDDRVNEAGRSRVKPATAEKYIDECDKLGQRAALLRDVAALGLRELNGALSELRAAYQAVRDGLSQTEFDATLWRVNVAWMAAESTPAHIAQGPEDDPFDPDA